MENKSIQAHLIYPWNGRSVTLLPGLELGNPSVSIQKCAYYLLKYEDSTS